MHLYFNIFGLQIPAYGLMIVVGVIVANLLAIYIIKKYKLDGNDFLVLEGYLLLGAFFGAKILYLLVSFSEIDWSKITDLDYFNQLMQGGFVFYGGLIGGLLFVFLAGKIHHIKTVDYCRHMICFIPLAHCFGRIGCVLAGCCYGIPYSGSIAIVYPKGSLAPSGIKLFPVQLVEAIFLFCIFVVIFFLDLKKHIKCTIALYIILYSILRYFMEYYRYDRVRGILFHQSTSQWISIFMFCITVLYLVVKREKDKHSVKKIRRNIKL